jgi:hypothetical protein
MHSSTAPNEKHPALPTHPASVKRLALLKHIPLTLLLLVLLPIASRETRVLRDYRHGPLSKATGYSAEVPPMLVFANVALAGFRGIIADLLWLRGARMQEEGRYLELVQLSEWITALEPFNGDVWAYHGWNLAYNVSAMMTRPEDRWRWVRNGIELLCNQGVRLNPTDSKGRWQLAWIFQHKLGSHYDEASNYYRTEWARCMAAYVEQDGSPPPADSISATEMRDVLMLDAERMREIDKRFGPLDWRVPGSHAVYWALDGLRHAPPREQLSCERVVYQSLIMMILGDGKLSSDPLAEDYEFAASPNEGLMAGTIAFLEEVNASHHFYGVRMAFCGLLLEGVKTDLRQGLDSAARAKYKRVGELFGGSERVPAFQEFVDNPASINWSNFKRKDD